MEKEKKVIKPKMLDLETSATCNLRCVGCPINHHKTSEFMDFDYYKSIIDRAKVEIPDVTICNFMNGEPLMHPRYLEMLKYADDARLRYYFTTNGHFFNEELFRYILRPESTCYQIIFSLDGLPSDKSKSIELARPGSDREKVLDTIEKFGKLKEELGSHVDMAIKIVDRGQDFAEFEEYVHYWLDKSYVDYVCRGKMLAGETNGMRYKPCKYSDDRFLAVRWDGEVISCAYHPTPVKFGKLDKTTPLLEFYNNKAMTEFRDNQNKGIYAEPCKKCGFAYTGSGFEGTLNFRDKRFGDNTIYFKNDYYNEFYSYKLKQKYKTSKEV